MESTNSVDLLSKTFDLLLMCDRLKVVALYEGDCRINHGTGGT
jgi:hypothetical protein